MTYCIYIYYEQWIYIFAIELVCVYASSDIVVIYDTMKQTINIL